MTANKGKGANMNPKYKIKKILFKIAKGPFMGRLVGIAFQYGSWAIPVKKTYNSKAVLAFCHPQPSYENHMILSPKRAIQNLQQLASGSYNKYFMKVWEAAEDLCAACPEYRDSFVMVANGGKRQEVQQVHFHMFTNHKIVQEHAAQGQNAVYADRDICVTANPDSDWEIHLVIQPALPAKTAGSEADKERYFAGVLRSIDLLDTEFHIVEKGYSLVYQYNNKKKSDGEYPVFHLVSGAKRR